MVFHRAVTRPTRITAALLLALLLGACAGLPPGVMPAPRDADGAGTLTLPSGREVAVLPEDLEYTGSARFVWPDGRIYDGEWVAGEPHGEGVETRPDGGRYQGAWRDGRYHGHGTERTPEGQRYVGDFVEGVRQGSGVMTGPEGTYRGGWANDLPHGSGTFEGSDGTVYEGGWRQGQRYGYGRYTMADGTVYDGEWAADRPNGFGRLESPDGAAYEGEWQQGQRHGYGRAEGPPGLVYEGTWRHDERQGYGIEHRPDGSSYEGDWQQDLRHGQGREDRPDGAFHEGAWEFNQALGPGRRRAATGIEISGMWNDDSVSTGLLTLPTGLEYAGPLFSDGNRKASPRLAAWLEGAAGRGDPYAQLMLGTLYLDFDTPPPDLGAARRWLGHAAEAGIAEAQYRLALTFEGENPPRVVELLAEAARQNHPGANETLGEYYDAGITVPPNPERAIGYYQRAVAAGSVPAHNNLAWLLATTPRESLRDGPRAVELIRGIARYTGAWQYLDTLAAAWAAAGDFERAAAAAEDALAAAERQLGGDFGPELDGLERRLARYREGLAWIEPPADAGPGR